MTEMKIEPLSEEAAAFLKIATAAPDFQDTSFEGIPDGHSGPTVTIKQYVTSTVEARAGFATYFMATPQPDTAYWTTSVVTGQDWSNGQDIGPTLFPKSGQIFNNSANAPTGTAYGGGNSSQLSSVRLASSSFELAALNNAFNVYGSITAFKLPLQATVQAQRAANGAGQPLQLSIAGIDGVRSQVVGSQSYSAPVKDGVYAVSMNRESEYDFFPVKDSECLSSQHPANFASPPTATDPPIRANFNGPMTVFDNNFDTIVFRVDVPADVPNQSFLLKRWVTFEGQPVFNSLLWDTSHLSPRHEPNAIQLYQDICRGLPTAVARKDNPDFWKRVLDIISETSEVLQILPGPYGQVASGVHAVASALQTPSTPTNRRQEPRRTRTRRKKKMNVRRRRRRGRRRR